MIDLFFKKRKSLFFCRLKIEWGNLFWILRISQWIINFEFIYFIFLQIEYNKTCQKKNFQ